MPIVRHSAANLRLAARVDRAKLSTMTENAIDQQIAADPDLAPAMTEEQIASDIAAGRAEQIRQAALT